MFRKTWSLLFVILVLASSSAQAAFISEKMELKFQTWEQGVQISAYETLDHEDFYQPRAAQVPTLLDLQQQVRTLTDVDPSFLLKRQRAIFESVGFDHLLPRFDLVLAQKLFEISFLEQILFELHAETIQKPLFQSYSEFGANILLGPKGELAIIFISNADDAKVPDTEARKKVLKDYLAKGFKYKIHIHNHPFNFHNQSGGGDIAGTTIPSGEKAYGDVGTYLLEKKNYRLENAWITNGFNTLRIEALDFGKY